MPRKAKPTPIPPLRHFVEVQEVARRHWAVLDPKTEAIIGHIQRVSGKFEARSDDMVLASPRDFNAAIGAILDHRRARKG